MPDKDFIVKNHVPEIEERNYVPGQMLVNQYPGETYEEAVKRIEAMPEPTKNERLAKIKRKILGFVEEIFDEIEDVIR